MTVTINMHFNDKVWRRNGILHNKYGPTSDYLSGNKAWYFNGVKHRLNGPAIVRKDGYNFWYIDGVEYTYLEYIVACEQLKTNKENI